MIKIQQKGYFHSISEFHIFENKVLGNGSFGIVSLAAHIKTCKLYAIKIVMQTLTKINLKKIEDQPELELVQKQMKIHSLIDHPHISKLWDTITENDRLYMIMEYVEKGSLFHHQNKCTRFPQAQAFKYFYQTLSALKHLHSQSIIHRDLKPQNLLLDANLNIKLCDFGWATRLMAKRSTFCGTYEYMAPEIVFQRSYDEKVDIWALGVLLYELLHGYAPFRGELLSQIKNKMKVGAYSIMGSVSKQCQKLIKQILKFEPEDRITIQAIQNHEWVQEMQKHLVLQYIESEYFSVNNINSTKTNKNVKKDVHNHYRNNTQLENFNTNSGISIAELINVDKNGDKFATYKQLGTVSTKNTISGIKKGEGEEKIRDQTPNSRPFVKTQVKVTPEITIFHAKNSINEELAQEQQNFRRKANDNQFGDFRTKSGDKRCKTLMGSQMEFKKVQIKKKKEDKNNRNVTPTMRKRKSQGIVDPPQYNIYRNQRKQMSKEKSKSKSKSRSKEKEKSKSKEKSKQKVYRMVKNTSNMKMLSKVSSQPSLTPLKKKK